MVCLNNNSYIQWNEDRELKFKFILSERRLVKDWEKDLTDTKNI